MTVARARPEASLVAHDNLAVRLARLEGEVERLGAELARLERQAELTRLGELPMTAVTVGVREPKAAARSAHILTHVGQALIALGLAYLLRALTDGGLIGRATGVWLGLAYATGWTIVAAVVAARDRMRAWFAGALTPILALPVIVEAALRFDVWTATVAYSVLAAVTAGSLLGAMRTRHQSLAWMASLGGGVVAAVLMVGLRAYEAAAVFFIALGIATLWIGYVWEWTLLRWPAALAADVIVTAVVLRAVNPYAQQSPETALAVLLLLLTAYPVSILVRTILMNRSVVLFEVAQSVALLLLLRGALALVPVIGSSRWLLGVSIVGLGAAAFATAVLFSRRAQAAALNVHFYAALGAIVLMVGWAILLDGGALGAAWSATALAIAAVALICRQPVFSVHAMLLGVAAAVPCGLVSYAAAALAGGAAAQSLPPGTALAAFALVAVLLRVLLYCGGAAADTLHRVALFVGSVVALCAAAGLVAGVVVALVGSASTVRTVVLSAAAVSAAAVGQRPSFGAVGWMAYPFLAFVAVKLLAADLRADRPLALFVALAIYGTALITIARFGRRR
jgi:hypothetical protein